MTNPEYLKCPGGDPVSRAVPELIPCPECGIDIEIWTDEPGGKCTSCLNYFKKSQPIKISDNIKGKIDQLVREAERSGASQVVIVSAKDIVVDHELADRCKTPRCENYGLAKSCPPHVSGPSIFKERLETYDQAIFFNIIVPTKNLFSSDRREFFQLLHEIGAGIELSAVEKGFEGAKAYTGGSCKKIFCHDHLECRVVSGNGKCRNPLSARPSMSGFGVDVAKLTEACGWTMEKVPQDTDVTADKTAKIYGLVLVD